MPDPQIDPNAGGPWGGPGRGTITIRSLAGSNPNVPTAPAQDQYPGHSGVGPGQAAQAAAPTVDPGWANFSADYQPAKIGQPLQPEQGIGQIIQGAGAQLMQAMPSFGGQQPTQPANDDWSHLSAAYEPTPQSQQPMGQDEAALHGIAHGATASWSPVIAGGLAVSGLYELENNLRQAQSMGMLDPNGEQMLKEVQDTLSDPAKVHEVYRTHRDQEQGNVATANAQYPWTTGISEGVGAIATPLPWAKGGAAAKGAEEAANIGGKLVEPMTSAVKERVAPWVQNALQAIKSGAGYGATSGAGASVSQGDDPFHVAMNTLFGTGIGALGGAILSPAMSVAGAGANFAKDRFKSVFRGIGGDLALTTPSGVAEKSIQNAEKVDAPTVAAKWSYPHMRRRVEPQYQDEGALVRGNQGGLAVGRLARTAADTSDAAAQLIKEHVERVYAGQSNRVANGIRIMLLGKGRNKIGPKEIEEKLEKYEEQVRQQTRSGYNTLYNAYSGGMRSEELERLSGAEPVQEAMRDAYKRWQSRVVADKGLGAPRPIIEQPSTGAGPSPERKTQLQQLIRASREQAKRMEEGAKDSRHPEEARQHYAQQAESLRDAVKRYAGELNSGISKQGVMLPKGKNLDTPIVPNIQFWDYVKREMDGQIRSALRGTNPRGDDAHMLISLKSQLYDELDHLTNGLYSDVVSGAAKKFRSLGVDAKNMFEAGAGFVMSKSNRELDGDFEKVLNGANPAERELFRYGFITEILSRLENMPERENVINQLFLGAPGKGSESARRRIKMALRTPSDPNGTEGANQLEALLRVETVMDQFKQATQGNSHTGEKIKKYFNEGALTTGAALFGAESWRNEDPDRGLLEKFGPTVGMLIGLIAAGRGRQFDDRVARAIAEKLLSGSPEGEREVVNMFAKSPKLMQVLRTSQTQFADWMARQEAAGAPTTRAGMAIAQPFNRGTPLENAPSTSRRQ